MTGPGRSAGPPPWRPTLALVTAAVAGSALLVVAAASRHPALAVLAAPLLADVAWALRRVRRPPLVVGVGTDLRRVREGDRVEVRVDLAVPADADLVAVTVETEPLLAAADPARTTCGLPPAGPVVEPAVARHWGRAPGGQVHAAAWAGHGLLQAESQVAVGAPLAVEPAAPHPGADGPVRRLTRVVGPRPSRRPGAGTEFGGVRGFVAGDRLRHVNWRVTARRGDLHVTTTTADREATLLLLLDTSSELGPVGATSLDVAVRAAAALARRHLHAGDRVGLVDLARPSRVPRPGVGRRHLDRVVDALLDTRRRAPGDLTRLPGVLARTVPGAVVVVLSPLLREAVAAAVARLAQEGRAVVVVDTLPDVAERGALDVGERLARLAQELTVDRLADVGVPVLRWRDGLDVAAVATGRWRVGA